MENCHTIPNFLTTYIKRPISIKWSMNFQIDIPIFDLQMFFTTLYQMKTPDFQIQFFWNSTPLAEKTNCYHLCVPMCTIEIRMIFWIRSKNPLDPFVLSLTWISHLSAHMFRHLPVWRHILLRQARCRWYLAAPTIRNSPPRAATSRLCSTVPSSWPASCSTWTATTPPTASSSAGRTTTECWMPSLCGRWRAVCASVCTSCGQGR